MKTLTRFFSILLLLSTLSVHAELKLPSIVSDGMVLQRDVELKVWGWAKPGNEVVVNILDQVAKTKVSEDGDWMVTLQPLSAGGPVSMQIRDNDGVIELKDILVGDVWLCSGQSNMTHTFVRWQEEYADAIASSENSQIRQFQVPTRAVLSGPVEDVPGSSWKAANPETLLNFTVVGYAFAKQLFDRYQVPQGILMSCVGGTRIEAWTSEAGFKDFPEQLEIIERNKDTAYVDKVNAEAKAAFEAMGTPAPADKGTIGAVKWYDLQYEPRNWKSIHVPGYWEDQGVRNLDGVVWYRKTIELPDALAGKKAKLKLGRIINADDVYVNGELVGRTTYQYPQRRYTIPEGLLKSGENILVVRIRNNGGKGGFVPDKPYVLEVGGQQFNLHGQWHYRVGEVFVPRPWTQSGIHAQSQPASLFNGMIAPLVNHAVRGMLWYQGESNAGNPEAYRKLMPNLIQDWRNQWGGDDSICFLIAQLPNYMDVNYLPEESGWAEMRDAQMYAAKTVPNTGIAVNLGLGEWNDIHPGNKMAVGDRMALQAMKWVYAENDIVASGPLYASHTMENGKITIQFDSVGKGLKSLDGEALAHFAIAGEDRKFVWATAAIEGDSVVVTNDHVSKPKYLRYAWADNPDFANLGNSENLPAAPFEIEL